MAAGRNKISTNSKSFPYQFHLPIALHSPATAPENSLDDHKYRGCIVVLSINKSVEPNEEQKVLTSSFDEGFTVNAHRQVFRGF